MKNKNLKFSYTLGLTKNISSTLESVNTDIDLGASVIFKQVYSMIYEGKTQQAFNYLKSLCNEDLCKERGIKFSEVYFLLARVMIAESKLDEALMFASTACGIDPEDFQNNSCLAEIYYLMEAYKEAIDYYQKSLKSRPNHSETLRMIGECCLHTLNLAAATKYFLAAVAANDKNIAAYQNLATSLHSQGKTQDALDVAKLYLNVFHQREVITRHEADAHGAFLFMRMAQEMRFDKLMKDFHYWSSIYASDEGFEALMEPVRERKIRVGYVGSDFFIHAASSIYRPLFEYADKDRFEIFVYSSTERHDFITDIFKSKTDHWYNVNKWSDDQVFKQIKTDKIDILVDLNGHTANNRLLVFTRWAAPIQMTGLGFLTPLNIPQIDYYFTDKFVTDEWREKQVDLQMPVYIPSILHYYPPVNIDDSMLTERPHVEAGYITFGCANSLYKMNQAVIGVWAQILKRVPKSKLAIKAKQFECELTKGDFIKKFTDLGIEASRIEAVGITDSKNHILFMNNVDIALDPFPYQGGVTSCECLYMGVPLITMNEGTKTSVTLVNHTFGKDGAKALIAEDQYHYIDIATTVAKKMLKGEIASRQDIRAAFMASRVCDHEAYCKSIEKRYSEIFNAWHDAYEETEKEMWSVG